MNSHKKPAGNNFLEEKNDENEEEGPGAKTAPSLTMVPQTAPATVPSAGGYCTANECFAGAPSAPTTLSAASTVSGTQASYVSSGSAEPSMTNDEMPKTFANNTSECKVQEEVHSEAAEIFTPEFYQSLQEAVKHGLAIGSALKLIETALAQYLRSRSYSEDRIYWINQAARAAFLVWFGSSIEMVAATFAANYFLTAYAEMSPEGANVFTLAVTLAKELVASERGVVHNVLIIPAAIGASVVGSRVAGLVFNAQSFFSRLQGNQPEGPKPQNPETLKPKQS